MADFLEKEADLSEGEGSDDDEEVATTRKRVVSSDSEEEEEDDEERIKAEMTGFVVDNDEEDDAEDSNEDHGGRRKKRVKRKKEESDEEDDELDEDDLDLIENNTGVKINRKKQLKRVKKVVDSDDSGDEKGEEDDRAAVAKEIFESDDEDIDKDELPDLHREAEEEGLLPASSRRRDDGPEDGASDEESDPDDFIVDEDGQPVTSKKKLKKVKHSDAALQEAQDIFGVDFDFQEFDKYGDDRDEDSESYDEDEDEEDEESRRKARRSKKSASRKTIYELYEPSELERGFFTDADHEIRTMDSPERFLLRKTKVLQPDESRDTELQEEAEWIYKNAFQTPTVSNQEFASANSGAGGHDQFGYRDNNRSSKGPQAIPRIREALNFMRNNQFEVPFIAFYRKEYVEPDLNINDLWKVYYWDEKWMQLQGRKENLVRLFEKMQSFQADQILADPDKPLDDTLRVLDDDDIARVRRVDSPEELNDVYQHFLLYYGREVPKMQAAEKAKARKERKETRKREREEMRRQRSEEDIDRDEPEDDDDDEEDAAEEDAHAQRLASRRDPYSHCQNYNLDTLAKRFGLTPEQFGENLRDNYARHEVDQYPADPIELAKELVDDKGSFSTPEEVLTGARFMVASQIAREPLVRQCVRQTFYERAKICITPTKKGKQDIDEAHPCYTFKYLRNKPVRDLCNDEFLKMLQAEQEGLLHITMGVDVMDPSNLDVASPTKYVDEVKELYRRDEFSTQVQQWNEQRALAVEKALHQMLYPVMAKELRQRLSAEAKEYVTSAARKKLYSWIRIAPYKLDQQFDDDDDYNDNEKGPGLRAFGVCFAARDPNGVGFGAILDGDGEVSDFIKLKTFCRCNKFGQMAESWQEEYDEEKTKLKKFIHQKKPHVIVCAADERSGRDTRQVVDRFKEVVAELEEEKQMPPVSVEMMETNAARIYSASKKAENDYRDYPDFLRIAVSVARRIQDPMMEFAQLCNADDDILCLNFHPLQHLLDKDEFLESLSLEFINRVNEVGVDINKSLIHSPTANLLQFVCGLGPRKAQFIVRTLKTNKQRLENRSQLVHNCQMGPKVFMNSAGFIRIDTNSLGDSSDSYLEVLDSTRVHPETYEWARKMAVDALEYDDTSDDANPAAAVEEILESPERLKDLDLDAFAVELERQGYGNKSITLYDIRSELNHKYKDMRTDYRPPSNEEIFNMLTGENPETFYVGKLIMVKVTGIARRRPQNGDTDQANPVRNEETGLWQCPFCLRDTFPELSEVWSHFDSNDCPGQAVGVKCRLDNDCFGFLPTKFISDKPVQDPEQRVKVGMTIYARITKIDIDRFSVDLTARGSELADVDHQLRPRLDDYYDKEQEEREKNRVEEDKKRKAKCNYIRRVIAHPSFHNIPYKEAEKLLMDMEQGEVIIRPSSKGASNLTVSWKVTDTQPIIAHIDVKEENKENDFSLGQSLWIGEEAFEDLDEIIARHVQPMAAFSRDILNHKYYREAEGGNREIMHKLVLEEKKKGPSRIPYYFSASKEFPGKFLLSYAPKMKPRHEYLTVTPDGLRFRGQIHHSLNACVNWFKEHFKDPIPGGVGGGSTPMSLSGNTPRQSVRGTPTQQPNQRPLGGFTAPQGGTPYGAFPTPGAYGASVGQPFPSNTPRAQQTPAATTPVHPPQATPSFHRSTPAQGAMPPPASSARVTPAWATPAQQNAAARATPRGGNAAATDWSRAAQEWAAQRNRRQPGGSGNTPRASGNTPRTTPGGGGTPRQDDPRRTPRSPFTGASPRSTGGATPLYDEVG